METVNRPVSKKFSVLFLGTASRFIKIGLLIYLAFVLTTSAQTKSDLREINQAQTEFNYGNFSVAIKLAEKGIEKAKLTQNKPQIFKGLDLIAISQISLRQYAEAEDTLKKTLSEISETEDIYQKALIYIRLAWAYRSQYKFSEALNYSKQAFNLIPQNRQIKAEHYLNIGRILFASGYDISAIIWLEKAERVLEKEPINSTHLDIYRYLSLAWYSRLNYQTALRYAEKFALLAEKQGYKHKQYQALHEWATILNATGQKQKANIKLEKGLKLAGEQNNFYQSSIFLTSLLLNSLYKNDVNKASVYLQKLEKTDTDRQFFFEISLAKAIIAAFKGEKAASEKLFTELDKMENSSEFILPYWKITIAEKNGDWEQVVKLNEELLKLTEARSHLINSRAKFILWHAAKS